MLLLGAAFSFDVREELEDFFFFDVALELILNTVVNMDTLFIYKIKSLDGLLFGDTRRKDGRT